MTRVLTVVVAAAAVLAGTVAAGCGGGANAATRAEYQETIVLTRDRVDAALANIPRAKSVADYIARMLQASEAIERAADDLDEAGRADGFDDETNKLGEALHSLSIDIEGTAEQVKDPDFQGILLAKGFNWPSWDKANSVLADLKKQGIQVEPLARH